MSTVRKESIYAVINRATSLIDTSIHNNIHKHHEFKVQSILADKSLTKDEKTEAIRRLNKVYDINKVFLMMEQKEFVKIAIKNA